MKKAILMILEMNDNIFNEEKFIQNVLRCIPNNITISMKEIISEGENCSISEDDIKKVNEVMNENFNNRK